MVSLVADDATLLKDVGLFIEPIEVYDPAGKLLGLFVPANLERSKERQAQIAAQIDPAEVQEWKNSKGEGVPLRDVFDRLHLLEKELERRNRAGEKELTTEEALAYFQSLRGTTSTPNGSAGLAALSKESDQCPSP